MRSVLASSSSWFFGLIVEFSFRFVFILFRISFHYISPYFSASFYAISISIRWLVACICSLRLACLVHISLSACRLLLLLQKLLNCSHMWGECEARRGRRRGRGCPFWPKTGNVSSLCVCIYAFLGRICSFVSNSNLFLPKRINK